MIVSSVLESITNAIGSVFFANVLFFLESPKLPLLIFWILCASLFFLIKLDFINLRYFGESFKIFFQKEKQDNSGKTITSRSAFLGAISGCVGIGSISGVAASIYYGGPGVIFWLLVASFLCMPIRYAEVFLGHYFRKKDKDGNIVLYGPFAYIKNGLAEVGLGKFANFMKGVFAICLLCTSVAAIMTQIQPTTEMISDAFFEKSQTASIAIAGIIGVLTLFVIFGGLSRISKVIEKMAIVMSLIYIASIFAILLINFKNIPQAVSLIISSAFELKSVYGGIFGTLIVALTRIITMNEIGLGTVALLHGKSKNEDSVKEGLLAMSGPFVAILVFVALNGFALIVTGSHLSNKNGALMVASMFASVSPILHFALIIVALLFAITTLIAWYFYAETSLKTFKCGDVLAKIYPVVFLAIVLSASVISFGLLLNVIDVIGIMVIFPNIIILFLLSKVVKKEFKKWKKGR